jgi:hypothetical protein
VLAAGSTVIELHPTWGIPGVAYPSNRPLVLAHMGGKWQRDDTPMQRSGADPASIQTAAFISSGDPWLTVGLDGATNEPRLLHLSTGGWSRVTLPVIAGIRAMILSRVVTVSATEGWAVGSTILCQTPYTSGVCSTRTLILHEVNGAWSVTAG